MSYCFIALIDTTGRWNESFRPDEAAKLREMGLYDRLTTGSIKLFTSPETPTLSVPCGGMVIGHLFARDGTPIDASTHFPNFSSPAEVRKHLMENCWGEYLLFQPASEDTEGTTIMREPSGGISCIYSIQMGAGFIASDISLATSINIYAKQVDWDVITHCLLYPHQAIGRTGLAEVRELLPGYSLRVRGFDVTTEQEWSPWDFVASEIRHRDPHEAAVDIRKTVATVVSTWAETDESILMETSGGLDSSIVAACLQGTRARVACCTLVTPVPGADERQYASLVANHLGVDLCSEELPFDAARFDFVPPTYLMKPGITHLQFAANMVIETVGDRYGVASYFSGGGGDAVFGFLKTAAPAADAFRECGFAGGVTAIRNLAELHQCTFWKAGKLTLRKLLRTPRVAREPDSSFLSLPRIGHTPAHHPWLSTSTDSLPGDRERIGDLAGTQAFRDGLPRGARRRLRMPLLSQPVVEACLKVPSWMCIADGSNRAIARRAFADLLPQKILDRRSKGTFVSYSGAVYQRNKGRMREYLLSGHLQERGLLDTDTLNHFFDRNHSPRDRSFMRIFDLCVVENWVRHQV